jgi:hypothetical protein
MPRAQLPARSGYISAQTPANSAVDATLLEMLGKSPDCLSPASFEGPLRNIAKRDDIQMAAGFSEFPRKQLRMTGGVVYPIDQSIFKRHAPAGFQKIPAASLK